MREHWRRGWALPGVRLLPAQTEVGGDNPADLAALFGRHVLPLPRYCEYRVGPDAAEDVGAETFLVAYARRGHFDPSRSGSLTWLYGIATYVARRRRRARPIRDREQRQRDRLTPADTEPGFP
jgi:DNA-directed RNA polymerase specialized sigma24 family protein